MKNLDADGLDRLRIAGNLDSLSTLYIARPQDVREGDKTMYTGIHIRTLDEQEHIRSMKK